MNTINDIGGSVFISWDQLLSRFIDFIPSFLGAMLVFLLGLIVAVMLGRIIAKLVKVTKIDNLVNAGYFGRYLREHNLQFSISELCGGLVKWFLVLVSLLAAADILGLYQVTEFLNSIILYIPNIVVAVVILSIAFLLANFVYKVVHSSVKAAGVVSATLLAVLAKWSIILFGILAAFIQLGIAESLAEILFAGIVAGISLAFGLAFGLGGREEAALILRKIRKEVEEE